MKGKRSIYTKMLSITLLIIGMSGCAGGQKTTEHDEQKAQIRVKVSTVVRDTVKIEETFSANLEAYVKNNIAPQTPNRISQIAVEVGQNVARGQVLVTLNRDALDQSKIQLDNQEAEYRRMQKLYDVGGLSMRDIDAMKTSLQVNRAAYNNLQQNTMLRSPISGIVTARHYDAGDMVSPTIPILVVEQIAPLKMKVSVSENYFTLFRKGNAVSVVSDLYPNETFEGVVSLTYPTIDSRTRTFEAEVQLPNHDHRLRPGMYVRATVDMGQKELILVPDVAVKNLPGTDDRYVFVLQGSHVVRTPIAVGELYGNRYAVLNGLEAGDQVVVAGFSSLRDGDEVEVTSL